MRQIPRWVLVSASAAPVLLIGGWTIAAARQPMGYSPVRDTISALAGVGAKDRWVMTSALAGLGVCHIATAAGLRPVRSIGRLIYAIGGLATIGVAMFPQPVSGDSIAHTTTASIAFVALGAWPLFTGRRKSKSSVLSLSVGVMAAGVMLGCVSWFVGELHGGQRGLAERMAAGTEALWPLIAVLALRKNQHPDASLGSKLSA